jgi:flagellar assembly protein FliH
MSEIFSGDLSSAAPVPWRTVNAMVLETSAARAADEELERRIEQARREGMEEGFRTGHANAHCELPATLENISRSLAELDRTREKMRDEAGRELVRLAVTVAACVIHREMAQDGTAMAGLVRAALLKLQSREVSRVRMHPALESIVAATLEKSSAPGSLVLMPDATLRPGDLLFETSQGVLDASLDTQIREFERGLLDQLGQ